MSDGRIAILTATRGRPEKLKRMLQGMGVSVADKSRVSHWIAADEDDLDTINLVRFGQLERLTGYPVHLHVGPKPRKLPDVWNGVWRAARQDGDIFIGFTDDYEVRSHGWDEQVRRALGVYDDGIAIAHLPDPTSPNVITIICATARVFEELGYFVVPYFPYWFADSWMDNIATMIQRRIRIDIEVGPQDGSRGRTQGMRNLRFWFDFSHQMLGERREMAEKLRRLAYPIGSPKYIQSRQNEEELIRAWQAYFDQVSLDRLDEIEKNNADALGPPSATYLAIEEEARQHLKQWRAKQP